MTEMILVEMQGGDIDACESGIWYSTPVGDRFSVLVTSEADVAKLAAECGGRVLGWDYWDGSPISSDLGTIYADWSERVITGSEIAADHFECPDGWGFLEDK